MRLSAAFFNRAPDAVAPELIGTILTHTRPGGEVLSGMIVETEAYLGPDDAAAHAARGPTHATRALRQAPGTLYVHPMRAYVGLDIVTGPDDAPTSVLIRALQPLTGIARMQANMGQTDETKLANGPGKLCRALAITKAHYGLNLLEESCPITLHAATQKVSVITTPRIGITKNPTPLLRFTLKNSPYLSK